MVDCIKPRPETRIWCVMVKISSRIPGIDLKLGVVNINIKISGVKETFIELKHFDTIGVKYISCYTRHGT